MTQLAKLRSPEEKAARQAIARWAPVVACQARRFAGMQHSVQYDELAAAGQLAVVEAERGCARAGAATDKEWRSFVRMRVTWAMKDALRCSDHLSRKARRDGFTLIITKAEDLAAMPAPASEPERPDDSRRQLAPLLDSLRPRDRAIVEATFLGGRTVEDLGRELGVSAVRISQIRTRSLRRMRALALGEPAEKPEPPPPPPPPPVAQAPESIAWRTASKPPARTPSGRNYWRAVLERERLQAQAAP